MAESEESHLPADGQHDALSTEVAGQVFCGAPSHSARADEVGLPNNCAKLPHDVIFTTE